MHTPIAYISFNIKTSIFSYGVNSFGFFCFLNGQYDASVERGIYIVVSGAKSVILKTKLSHGLISSKSETPSCDLTDPF